MKTLLFLRIMFAFLVISLLTPSVTAQDSNASKDDTSANLQKLEEKIDKLVEKVHSLAEDQALAKGKTQSLGNSKVGWFQLIGVFALLLGGTFAMYRTLKSDLGNIDKGIGILEAKQENLHAEITGLTEEIGNVRDELQTNIRNAQERLQEEIGNVKDELRTDFREAEARLQDNIDRAEARLEKNIEKDIGNAMVTLRAMLNTLEGKLNSRETREVEDG